MTKKLALAIFGILLLVATSAHALDKVDWQLTVKGDFVSLEQKPIVIDVTNEAKSCGQDKIIEAYERKGLIVPLEKILQRTKIIHLFYTQSESIATMWIVHTKSKNLIEVKAGKEPYIEHHFNPVLILWLVSLFYFIIISAKIKLTSLNHTLPTKKLFSYTNRYAFVWILFCLSAGNINAGSLLPTIIPIMFFLAFLPIVSSENGKFFDENILRHTFHRIIWRLSGFIFILMLMLLSLILVTT